MGRNTSVAHRYTHVKRFVIFQLSIVSLMTFLPSFMSHFQIVVHACSLFVLCSCDVPNDKEARSLPQPSTHLHELTNNEVQVDILFVWFSPWICHDCKFFGCYNDQIHRNGNLKFFPLFCPIFNQSLMFICYLSIIVLKKLPGSLSRARIFHVNKNYVHWIL